MNLKKHIASFAVVCGAMSTLVYAAPSTNGIRGSGAPKSIPAQAKRSLWDHIAYKQLENRGVARLQGDNSLDANDGPVEYAVRSHWSIVEGTRLVLHSSMSARQLFGDRTVLLTRHMSTVLYNAPRGRRILAADLSLPRSLRAIGRQFCILNRFGTSCHTQSSGFIDWRGRDTSEWCHWFGQDASGASAQVGYKMNVQFKVKLSPTYQRPLERRWNNYR